MERAELDTRLEYWLEQEVVAQKALEVAREQVHRVRCAIGMIVVKELREVESKGIL